MYQLFNCRKGLFFSLDALIALSIMLVAFSVVMGLSPTKTFQKSEYQQMHYLSDDAIQAFANTKFSSINETIRNEIMALPEVSGEGLMNKSLIEVVGLLWSVYNDTDYRRNYSANITKDFFSPLLGGMNYSLKIGDYKSSTPTSIYSSTGTPPNQEIRKQHTSAFRVISGYKENSPHTGFVARAFVAGATKKTQTYAYFGGFEGNGNITKILELPSIVDTIGETYMEMDIESNFTLYINDNYSGSYNVSGKAPLRAKNWTVPSTYSTNFVPGPNNITMAFSDINTAYIGGGFIRVKYNTTQMDTSESIPNSDGNVTKRYAFPGINGLINIYSSFYVPGVLKSLGIQLHYLSEYEVFLKIGNVSVYSNSSNVSKYIYLNDTYLDSLLDYLKFNQTMPIRFGTNTVSGMNDGSDAVLITDVSGSMGWCRMAALSGTDCDGWSPGIQRIKLDVAKESDIDFVTTILANPGQKVGIVSYHSLVEDTKTVNLTDNSSKLISVINTYAAGGSTCIACGIKTSADMLASTLNSTNYIANKSAWHYNDSFLSSTPPIDAQGRNWTHVNYSYANQWKTGNAVFGNGSYSIPITTSVLSNSSARAYPDLWDMAADKSAPEIDFTSGMNSTANTFGLGAGNDGWDWGAGYGYDSALARNTYLGAANGKLVYSTTLSGTNQCTNRDCSGGYGIQINITPAQYAVLSSGGAAYISFEYSWNTNRAFTSSDEVWIKGRWSSPVSGAHYLGSELSNSGGDTTLEIARGNNPASNFSGIFIQNITSWIESNGTYYLDFGGKLYANNANKYGNFSFDNVLLEISNTTDTIYFRKNFTIQNLSAVGKGLLRLMSDDFADVYINSMLAFNNSGKIYDAAYWNAVNTINRKYFRPGENIVAVKLYTKGRSSRFDAELDILNDSRNKAMLVMTDGDANVASSPYIYPLTSAPIIAAGSFSIEKQDAINRSCFAYENYGIVSYSVGFGADAKNDTLQAIAECGHGLYYYGSNAEDLREIYKNIANSIISYSTQTAEISGDAPTAKLYTDSFIEYNYTPYVKNTYGNISLTLESETFGNTSGNYSPEIPKNGSYNITSKMAVIDVKATSYSSDYWTSTLETNSTSGQWKTAFNLSDFGSSYASLGDPFIVNIPVSHVKAGEINYVRINTAKNSTNYRGGSPDNRIIYSIKLNGTVGYGNTFPTLENATEDAKKRLNSSLSEFGITITTINTGSQNVGNIPWMWGPAIITLEVWR